MFQKAVQEILLYKNLYVKKVQFSVAVGVYLQRNMLKNGMYQLYGNEKQKRLSTGTLINLTSMFKTQPFATKGSKA